MTSAMIILRELLWLPSQKLSCSISKFAGSAFELLLLKLSYWYHSATLSAEREWSCWNAKGAPLSNHEGFHKNGDENVSFNFSLLIPGNGVLIKIEAIKQWGKELKKKKKKTKQKLCRMALSEIQVFWFIPRKTSIDFNKYIDNSKDKLIYFLT